MATQRTADEVEALLNAGHWLGSDDLAVLFGRSRFTIWRWAKKTTPPRIRFVDHGSELKFDPADTLRYLAQWRRVHGG